MSKTKSEASDLPQSPDLTDTLDTAEVLPKADPEPAPVVFRDKLYTSRTLILPDGRAMPVSRGRISATDEPLTHYLTQHPDFEPLPES